MHRIMPDLVPSLSLPLSGIMVDMVDSPERDIHFPQLSSTVMVAGVKYVGATIT